MNREKYRQGSVPAGTLPFFAIRTLRTFFPGNKDAARGIVTPSKETDARLLPERRKARTAKTPAYTFHVLWSGFDPRTSPVRLPANSTCLDSAPWSSGQDLRFSAGKREFESHRGHSGFLQKHTQQPLVLSLHHFFRGDANPSMCFAVTAITQNVSEKGEEEP